jgi:PAS domain S-box-containing protein
MALLVVVGDLGLRRMDQGNADMQDIMGRQWDKLRFARLALAYSNRNSRITMQFFLADNEKQIEALRKAKAENSERVSTLIASLEAWSTSEDEKRLLAAIKSRRIAYLSSFEQAGRLLRENGKRDAATLLMTEQTTPLLLEYHAAWDDFSNFEGDQLEITAKRSRTRYAAARRLGFLIIAASLLVAGGIALFVMRAMAREISRSIQAEKGALWRAHQEAEFFINAVPSILIGIGQDSRITRWNLAASVAFGLPLSAVEGKPMADCGINWLRPDMQEEVRLWSSDRSPRRCDQFLFEKNGQTRLLGLTITPIQTADGLSTILLAIGSDITDRERVGDALREAERKYRGIFDDAIVGIFQSTPEGGYLSVNPAMARIFGYDSPGEMIACCADRSRQMYVDSKRRDEFLLALDKSGSVQNFECEVFRKDGSTIWIASSARAIRQDSVIVRYEGMNEDITERKLLQSRLLQAQKLESVGQLAAGIAHEINTPTQYVADNIRFLKDSFQDLKNLLKNYERLLDEAKNHALADATVEEVAAAVESADAGYLLEEIPKAIEQSLEGVTRVATLVSAMKEFSHPGTKEKTPIDLNHGIESTLTVARNEWKYVADVETEFDLSIPLVSCRAGEFNQVILNLIVNSAHAIGDVIGKEGAVKGKIRVQTRNFPDWVEIRIGDTGGGIPKNVQSRIFDPFFTTKAVGKGTGQGLAIARSVIVDKHGGNIHFETELGKGTTFVIRLPHDGKVLAATAASA